LPASEYGLKKFDFTLIFVANHPQSLELFDNTNGGKGTFVKRLNEEINDDKFIYKHIEENIKGVRDYVYKFKREQ
jgi:hypothetical protein